MPKVSVIIPVYGVEKNIERCARSLFEQTLDDIEYLFIDDCTPDRSIEVLIKVLEDYPTRKEQVIIHRMEQNSGQAAVRKWGMQNATGGFVIHCDSDDWVEHDMYRQMYEQALLNKVDVVVCDFCISDGYKMNKNRKACHSVNLDTFIENNLYQIDSWSLCNKLFKRSLYCNDNIIYPTGAMGEDMLVCIQLLLNSNGVAYVNEPFYYYYTNPSSISKSKTIESIVYSFEQAKQNTDLMLSIFEKRGLQKRYKYGLNYVQFTVLRLILPILKNDKKYYDVWLTTYKGMLKVFILNPGAGLKDKIRMVLAVCKLYPLKTFLQKI